MNFPDGVVVRGGDEVRLPNKTRDRIKLLHWDGTAMRVLAKRLENGRFSWPVSEALSMPQTGIDLKEGVKMRGMSADRARHRRIQLCLTRAMPPAEVLSRLPAMTTQDDLDALTPRRWQPA